MVNFDEEEDDDDGEVEEYSLLDTVCESVTSFVKRISDTVNPDPAETDQRNA